MKSKKNAASSSYTMDQFLVELCCLSYCDDTPIAHQTIEEQEAAIAADIAAGLQEAAMNDWLTVWGPVLSSDPARVFMAYVAADCENNYAVVIRGTDPDSIVGWLADVDVQLVAAPYGDDVRIAQGVRDAITVINGLVDASGQTITEFLTAQQCSHQQTVYVTGHSFGGTQATAYAPWLLAQGIVNVQVMAFAATTAGDASFASYFNSTFPNAVMYYNTLDIVPDIWADLSSIKDLYGSVGGPECPDAVKLLIDALSHVSSTFAGVGGQTAIEGSLTGTDDWHDEFPAQHNHNTYAALLGAPVLSIDEIEVATVLAGRASQPLAPAAAL